ncbi:GMC family oxidoreductase [Celeribacter naphthalenivorans]|uniref:GMC family oxidoreductase n=1 Tax=Celeribacter naphthalenivorans TaxID=1614694 RepID=UPI001CFAC0EA|nr:GMC family oxidoreductase N-terminal domain-containing protein [Celeribacter naphthalenivorans]
MERFDYIIVGAGSAGCVLADRLSEDGTRSVLVLEAGGRDSYPWIHIPLGYAKTFFNERLNWCFETEPIPGFDGRRGYAPQGKVLGGSSSINGLVYMRGVREDFDHWRELGNEGWGYDDVLPYFRLSEHQERGADAYHGVDGPLGVSDLRDEHPLNDAFIAASRAAGYDETPDFNGAQSEGVGRFQMTARNGRRASTAVSFLRRAERRPNVSLRTNVMVETLTLHEGRVTGLRYRVGDTTQDVEAKRLVVLSAGALNSPALLQRSGIGDPSVLGAAGVPVRHALPGVGKNLQDHVQARLVLEAKALPSVNLAVRNPLSLAAMGLRYAVLRRGPLAYAGGQSGGLLKTLPTLARPDIMYFVMPFSSADLRNGLDPFAGFTIAGCLQRPDSRGTVTISSPSAKDAPVIAPNFLDAPSDAETLVRGLRTARRIVGQAPLMGLVDREMRPGVDLQSDDELLAYVRSTASSVYHSAGTCRMGTGEDAVVDHRLRVHGLKGLAVADASIMPKIVSCPTNATAIMIGERAAPLLADEG